MVIRGIVKGDTIKFLFTLKEDITNWKIRTEVYDKSGNTVKLATTNSGGTSGDVTITDNTNGDFEVVVSKALTNLFNDKSYIEIEVETSNGELYTILQGSILLETQRIEWTSPS